MAKSSFCSTFKLVLKIPRFLRLIVEHQVLRGLVQRVCTIQVVLTVVVAMHCRVSASRTLIHKTKSFLLGQQSCCARQRCGVRWLAVQPQIGASNELMEESS